MHHVAPETHAMPTEIQGVEYFSQSEVAERIGVHRTTVWRWKDEGKIPAGRKFRGNQVLYTASELAVIEEFAFRLEPAEPSDRSQLGLF